MKKIKAEILKQMRENAAFDGWSWSGVVKAAKALSHEAALARAVFPGGLEDVLDAFADYADQEMMKKLSVLNPDEMPIRDRVRAGVMARFEVLAPHKEAERNALGYWVRPGRSVRTGKIVWRTADRIWNWAGDTATDYNHYTKRVLLSGILASTTLVWLDDDDPDLRKTQAFLDRRIENVMQLGKVIGKLKTKEKA